MQRKKWNFTLLAVTLMCLMVSGSFVGLLDSTYLSTSENKQHRGLVEETELALEELSPRMSSQTIGNHTISENTNAIYITSNAAFSIVATARGWSGTGSAIDPYLIESDNFVGNSTHLPIYIQSTSVYFNISGCTVTSYTTGHGVVLEDVSNGAVFDCDIVSSDGRGVRLLGLSNHCNLTSCSIDGGLQLVDAEHVRIENCVINGGEDAIDLLRVDGITIEECTVTSTQFDGIQVYSGNNVEISDCTVEGRTKLLYSYHSNLIDCTFKKGVDTYIAHFCEIRNNDISSELHLYDSGYNRIEDNRFSNGWVDISGENNRISAFVLDFSNNTIDGKLIGYYFNTTEMDVDATNIGSVIVAYCDDMKFHGGSLIGPVDFIWSNNTELTECTLSQNASLTVEDAINVTIAHNVIDTYGARIHIEDVLYITIEFNDVTLRCVDDGYSYMINSYYVDYTEFKNNSITITGTPDVGHDIQLDETNEVIFTGNTVQARDMRMHGHYLEFADNQFQCSVILESVGDLNILRNTFENSQDTGLNLESAYNVTIIGNKFLHNGKYGLELTHCDFCTIYNNSLGWNEEDNAYDNHGSNNIWDDGVSVGNAWSDYDGSGVYEIWGSSNSVDRYPSILLPTTTTTNGDFPVDILMLVGLISVIGIVVVVIVAIRLRSK